MVRSSINNSASRTHTQARPFANMDAHRPTPTAHLLHALACLPVYRTPEHLVPHSVIVANNAADGAFADARVAVAKAEHAWQVFDQAIANGELVNAVILGTEANQAGRAAVDATNVAWTRAVSSAVAATRAAADRYVNVAAGVFHDLPADSPIGMAVVKLRRAVDGLLTALAREALNELSLAQAAAGGRTLTFVLMHDLEDALKEIDTAVALAGRAPLTSDVGDRVLAALCTNGGAATVKPRKRRALGPAGPSARLRTLSDVVPASEDERAPTASDCPLFCECRACIAEVEARWNVDDSGATVSCTTFCTCAAVWACKQT